MRSSHLVPILGLATLMALPAFAEESRSATTGKAKRTAAPRIVGGVVATPYEFPWLTAVFFKPVSGNPGFNQQFCGGSLIHPEWVLTASHCTEGEVAGDLMVGASLHNLNLNNPPHASTQYRNVTQIIMHPSYNSSTLDYDIALLQLDAPINTVTPAYIPLQGDPADMDAVGTFTVGSGWGATNGAGTSYPTDLHKVDLPIEDDEWIDDYFGLGTKTPRMMAAGYRDVGLKDTCFGDSGGPLFVFVDNDSPRGALVLGITSYGPTTCADPDGPGVYTRVSELTTWIQSHVPSITPYQISAAGEEWAFYE